VKRRPSRGGLGRALTLATLTVIGVLWARVLFVQPHAEEGFGPVDSQQAEAGQQKLAEVSGAVSQLKAASQRGETRTRVLRLSDSDINAMLTAQPEVLGALEDARVRDLLIRIQDGRIITTATVDKGQVPFNLRAEGHVAARGGMLLYASTSVRVGGLPAPAGIRDAVDAQIQSAFRQFERQAQARVDRVTVKDDRLTLHLRSRPSE
jgi:hypothetical protein